MNTSALWYSTIVRPMWAPPSWLFGPVWSVLYVLIAISFGYVAYLYFKKRLPFKTLLPFVLNLALNLSYSPVQFGLRNFYLATVIILGVLSTLIWALLAIRKRIPWVALINLPYLAWVSFATVLQITVTWMNR